MTQSTFDQAVTQTVGYTTFLWDERTPLKFNSVTRYGPGEPEYPKTFDLSELVNGFEVKFLLGVKDLIMQRHLKVKAATIEKEYRQVLRLLKKIESHQTSPNPVERLMEGDRISAIDNGLMAAITAKLADDTSWIHGDCIDRLHDWFLYVGNGAVFAGLERGSFPTTDRTGGENLLRQKIIALALSRTMQVAVLVDLERRFQIGELHLGVYVLWNLTNFLYARPESLRQIRCGHIRYEEDKATGEIKYTLWLKPAKRGGRRPKLMAYPLTQFLGQLLFKQQSWVIQNIGPLYGITADLEPEQRGAIERKLALFPRINSGDRKDFEAKHFGMLHTGGDLSVNYLLPIQRCLSEVKVNFNVMRHTIGTQLAAAGVSAGVIQAVLRHATDKTARRYIDLAAKELRDKLSDGLEALEDLFPAYGAFMNAAQVRAMAQDAPERIITSGGPVDPATGGSDVETTGACGKAKACTYAPLSCYGCWRWIANVDADHSINLRLVQDRISASISLGKAMKPIVERDRLLEKVIMLRIAQIDKHKAEAGQAAAKQDATVQ